VLRHRARLHCDRRTHLSHRSIGHRCTSIGLGCTTDFLSLGRCCALGHRCIAAGGRKPRVAPTSGRPIGCFRRRRWCSRLILSAKNLTVRGGMSKPFYEQPVLTTSGVARRGGRPLLPISGIIGRSRGLIPIRDPVGSSTRHSVHAAGASAIDRSLLHRAGGKKTRLMTLPQVRKSRS
jgi:hypothetical protein